MMTFRLTAVALAALMLGACGGGDDDATPVPEEARDHDTRTFTMDPTKLPFDALPEQANSKRWWGVLDGAGYRVEVPENWNGKLVMFAHGYAGTGAALSVSNPSIRAHLLSQGYAWAASSYSTNYYDVRAGIEDTNNLALKFQDIAKANGVSLASPSKTYIVGQSMGGAHCCRCRGERDLGHGQPQGQLCGLCAHVRGVG